MICPLHLAFMVAAQLKLVCREKSATCDSFQPQIAFCPIMYVETQGSLWGTQLAENDT